jgi:endonuclease YncB( thermonuclease family)
VKYKGRHVEAGLLLQRGVCFTARVLSRNGRRIAVLAGLSCLAPASPAAALSHRGEREQCADGAARPLCHVWTGTVGKVNDGDTMDVDIDRDGTRRLVRVRVTGIQAMELTRYAKLERAGECLGVDATERLEQLVAESGGRVRLAAIDPASATGSERVRLRRQVSVMRDGAWVDAGALLLQAGLALWLASDEEWAWNGLYSRLAEEAASRRAGIWDGRSCGTDQVGPAANAVRLKVKWNANGNDAQNVNGEWVRITNTDPLHPLNLDGWWFRDSALRRYEFPAGAVVVAGGSVRLRIGKGADEATTFHWGLSTPAFDNATNDRRQMGDGGYLFDPRGNLRAHVQYPCRTSCREPLADKVRIQAHYGAPEYIRIRNTSNTTVNLFQYEVERAPWFYEFGRESVLLPGQRLDLYVQRSSGAFARSWGQPGPRLGDRRGVVTLRSPLGAPVTCDAWGGERCPDV